MRGRTLESKRRKSFLAVVAMLGDIIAETAVFVAEEVMNFFEAAAVFVAEGGVFVAEAAVFFAEGGVFHRRERDVSDVPMIRFTSFSLFTSLITKKCRRRLVVRVAWRICMRRLGTFTMARSIR